jgi:hypothetical protein
MSHLLTVAPSSRSSVVLTILFDRLIVTFQIFRVAEHSNDEHFHFIFIHVLILCCRCRNLMC